MKKILSGKATKSGLMSKLLALNMNVWWRCNMSKTQIARFFIDELRYDRAERKDIIEALVEELSVTKANAAAYIYNYNKK